MERVPNPSDPLIQAANHSASFYSLYFLPIGVPQQFYLFQYLLFLEVPHTYYFLPAVDIGASDNGVCVGAR